jgi:hypothetical protein
MSLNVIPTIEPASASSSILPNLPELTLPKIDLDSNDDAAIPGYILKQAKTKHKSSHQLRFRYRFLKSDEWYTIAHAIGGVTDPETNAPIHPTCWYWPPRGLPPGLYRDVVYYRSKFFILYHFLSTVKWIGLVLQLALGAVLTALGALSLKDGTPITIIAAANTINAGILALLHNSGLPDRYKSDQGEFVEVEDYLKELLDSGIVDVNKSLNDILKDCFDKYKEAKQTVQANIPAIYTPSSVLLAGKRVAIPSQTQFHTSEHRHGSAQH